MDSLPSITTDPAGPRTAPSQPDAPQGATAPASAPTTANAKAITPTRSTKRGWSNYLITRNYALLWSGQTLSTLGNMVFNTTLVIWIASQLAIGQSWASLAVSGVLLAAYVPAFVIGPFAGVFVDRMDKRRMMLAMDGLRAIIAAALILATGVIPLPWLPGGRLPLTWTLGAIYAIVFLLNIADRFFSPAMMALVGDLVPEAQQPKAMGLQQASSSLGSIAGPALAAALFITFGAGWSLLINALSFVASFLTILAIRAPKAATSRVSGARAHFFRELGEGLRFYVRSRVLMTLLVAIVVAIMGALALETLEVFFVTDNLHAPIGLYGLIGAAFGVGALGGAILASLFAERIGVGRTLWLCLLLAGVAVLVVSRITTFGPALALFTLDGFFIAGVNITIGPLMLRATPRELLGRVDSVISPAMSAGALLGAALAGYLASVTFRGLRLAIAGTVFGPVDTVYTIAGVLFVASAFVAMVGMRGVDRRPR